MSGTLYVLNTVMIHDYIPVILKLANAVAYQPWWPSIGRAERIGTQEL